MKQIQPFYYIVALAGLFFLAGLVLFVFQLFPTAESTGITVDPQSESQGETLYDLWFTSVGLYDLTVDQALSAILFSMENNTVNLLDRDRKLLWEKVFATAPKHAKISPCGNYAAVGTEGGRLFFTSADQEYSWDNEGDPIDLLAISPGASWLIAARTNAEEESHHLDLFNQAGTLKWTIETETVLNLFISSEYLEQAHVYFTEQENDTPVIRAINLDGREMWSHEGYLVDVSRYGSRLAAVHGNRLFVYDSMGYELWSTALPFEASKVLFNPQNYNRILVYGNRAGSGENLYYFDLADDLLWMKRVADGSLFSFTADGQHIITSSWRHYKEDYTQMILLDRDGNDINTWEVAMRVEYLLVTNHPHLIVVGGDDGYIDLIDLEPMLSTAFTNGNGYSNGNGAVETIIYNPVITGVQADQTWITIYFSDENSNLVPVARPISLTENPMRAALEELIRGPARGSSLYRTIPDKDVSVDLDYNADDGKLYLDLSPGFVDINGELQSVTALNSLLMTVSSFNGVKDIYLTTNRKPIESFGIIELEQPLSPLNYQKPVYIPVQSGNRFYLVSREGVEGELSEATLENLIEQVMRASRALPFVPSNLELRDINVSSEQVQVNLSRQFVELFPEQGNEEDHLRSSLILDAIFLTIFQNSRRQRAEIMIEGESWTPPEGYPLLNRFYRQPYFVNPE